MRHFKLNIERNVIPEADLCIAEISEEEHKSVVKAFTHTLIDCHIPFDYIKEKDQRLIAERIVVSWSISE